MTRVLDLGCGFGDSWRKLGQKADDWDLIGVDIAADRLKVAEAKYGPRGWRYICGKGETIPLSTGCRDGVLCCVSLPYMHIPKALAEIHRVLVPGGWLIATLHSPTFTWHELRRSFPQVKPTLFRVFVLLNGMVLHVSGNVVSIGEKSESCQTESGMRSALRRAGFTSIVFRHSSGEFFVEAKRDDALGLDVA
jgi:ubiquinone/menaquinone biosynthesis C-methylase UbiE